MNDFYPSKCPQAYRWIGKAMLVVLLLGLPVAFRPTEARSQEGEEDAATERAVVPWIGLTPEILDEEAKAGGNVYSLLRDRSPRQACPVAVAYLKSLAGGRELTDCRPVDLQELSTRQSFWLTVCYLTEHSETAVGIDWAAAVWREVVYLPDDCHFESALFDSGGGALLRALFEGCGRLAESRLAWLIEPMHVEDPTEEMLAGLWDYFTDYGGDVSAGDHLVKLDELAAALDLNPS